MSKKLQPARGTKDILAGDYALFNHIVQTAREVSSYYGFEEMATPIFEFTEVYTRTLGEVSDIVNKEMYTFEDRGGESITLRPEFTAGIARAFISEGLAQQTPLRLFSSGPLFRYERPQKGRQRQFHQLNFEMIGLDDPRSDVELLAMAANLTAKLGLSDSLQLEINSLGDDKSRDDYREALVAYLSQYKNDLSEDSKLRLEKNPLRILDSKDEKDKEIVANAPIIHDSYTDEAREFYDKVKDGLGSLGIKFIENPHLVRGLNYYSHTAFEFTTNELGAQNAVFAGGRYDKLIEIMGGPKTPAVGFAGGIERLMLLSAEKITLDKKRPVAILPMGQAAESLAFKLANFIRSNNIAVDMGYSGNLAKRMKRANKANAKLALIIGDDEMAKNIATVRCLDTGNQEEWDISESFWTEIINKITA